MARLKEATRSGDNLLFNERNYTTNLDTYEPWRNGIDDDADAFFTAFDDIGDLSAGHLYVPRGTYRIKQNIAFPKKLIVEFSPGARLYIDVGKTVQLNGRVMAYGPINTGPGVLIYRAQHITTIPVDTNRSIDVGIDVTQANAVLETFLVFTDGATCSELGRIRLGGTEDVNSLPAHAGLHVDPTSNDAAQTKHLSDKDLYDLSGLRTHRDDTGTQSTPNRRALLATETSRAAGYLTAVVASIASSALEALSTVLGSKNSMAMADLSGVLCSTNSITSAVQSIVAASYGVTSNEPYTVSGGFYPAPDANPLPRHTTWRLNAVHGQGTFLGGVHTGPAGALTAIYLENATPGTVLVLGSLIVVSEGKARQAADDEVPDGVVVAKETAGLVLADAPFDWAGKYEIDDWGRMVYASIPDPTWSPYVLDEAYQGSGQAPMIPNPTPRGTVVVPKLASGYNPQTPYTPREQRPEDWTLVGMTGLIRVLVESTVAVDDYLVSGSLGVGKKAASGVVTRYKVAKKVTDTIALCWVR